MTGKEVSPRYNSGSKVFLLPKQKSCSAVRTYTAIFRLTPEQKSDMKQGQTTLHSPYSLVQIILYDGTVVNIQYTN